MRKPSCRPTLGLCIVVKNGASTLRGCIESARRLVDSIVVVDTGSNDGTAAIAKKAGASVLTFAWNGSFADARNAALAQTKTDWVLVLDADEELPFAAHAWIRAEIKASRVEGYVVPVRNYLKPWEDPPANAHVIPFGEHHPLADEATHYAHSEVCRLFRRTDDVYYMGHVHEQVEYRLMQLGRPVARAGFFIHHFGWYLIDEEAWRRKQNLYSELLAQKLRERPNDIQVLVQYASALMSWQGKPREALEYFMKAAALEPEKHDIWHHIATALLKLGQPEAALIAVDRMADGEGFLGFGLRSQLRGEALRMLGRGEEAREAFLDALHHDPKHLAMRVQLGLLEIQMGNEQDGKARLRGALEQAEQEAGASPRLRPTLRAAELHARLEQWEDALRYLRIGAARDPESLPVQHLLLKAGVATGQLAEAVDAAARIVDLEPTPRAILRHAAILSQFGKSDAAADAISRGLERFPLSDELQKAGRELGALSPAAV